MSLCYVVYPGITEDLFNKGVFWILFNFQYYFLAFICCFMKLFYKNYHQFNQHIQVYCPFEGYDDD